MNGPLDRNVWEQAPQSDAQNWGEDFAEVGDGEILAAVLRDLKKRMLGGDPKVEAGSKGERDRRKSIAILEA